MATSNVMSFRLKEKRLISRLLSFSLSLCCLSPRFMCLQLQTQLCLSYSVPTIPQRVSFVPHHITLDVSDLKEDGIIT